MSACDNPRTVGDATLYHGDCLEVLRQLPAGSVQCCVTSPPYFGLRDYGCDGQIGLEPTPEEYVARLVAVFAEVRRVLADDGVCWVNLGDSYANDGKWGGSSGGKHVPALHGNTGIGRGKKSTGLKPKDLIGIPWRVAFALQADGWYLRQDIIWAKPNPMPESVTDRCTKAHEYLFLLTKSARYFWDAEAIAEKSTGRPAWSGDCAFIANSGRNDWSSKDKKPGRETRNRRSVWTVATQPYSGAHFAVMPPKLIEPCILAGSRRGDLILDPFNGAATVGVVAVQHGRRYLGIELNPEYIRISLDRLRLDAAQSTLALELSA